MVTTHRAQKARKPASAGKLPTEHSKQSLNRLAKRIAQDTFPVFKREYDILYPGFPRAVGNPARLWHLVVNILVNNTREDYAEAHRALVLLLVEGGSRKLTAIIARAIKPSHCNDALLLNMLDVPSLELQATLWAVCNVTWKAQSDLLATILCPRP